MKRAASNDDAPRRRLAVVSVKSSRFDRVPVVSRLGYFFLGVCMTVFTLLAALVAIKWSGWVQ